MSSTRVHNNLEHTRTGESKSIMTRSVHRVLIDWVGTFAARNFAMTRLDKRTLMRTLLKRTRRSYSWRRVPTLGQTAGPKTGESSGSMRAIITSAISRRDSTGCDFNYRTTDKIRRRKMISHDCVGEDLNSRGGSRASFRSWELASALRIYLFAGGFGN